MVLLMALSGSVVLAASNPMDPRQKRCSRPYFSPLDKNAIVTHLEHEVALSIGTPFRGSVATFIGARRPKQYVWVDNVTADWHVWYRSGNDMRTIGLWQYGIPTLQQANITMTPQFYLATTEFLTEHRDKQTWLFVGVTQPHEAIMPLWGVRYVVSDKPLSFGTERLQMPIEPTSPPLYGSPIRLYELSEPNVGNYSPTEVIRATNAADTLATLRRRDFDGRRMIVTDAALEGNFVSASQSSMSIIRGGFRLVASSPGESILVLPVQYSHCWTSTDPNVTFFSRQSDATWRSIFARDRGRYSARVRAVLEIRLSTCRRPGCGAPRHERGMASTLQRALTGPAPVLSQPNRLGGTSPCPACLSERTV
jgi:hypothetical protein